MDNEERWSPIDGYEGMYDVSTIGNVRTYRKKGVCKNGEKMRVPRLLKPGMNSHGYLLVVFQVNGIRKNKHVHQLVADAFIPHVIGKSQVNHIDGNKLNNNVHNLERCSPKENYIHALKTGLSKAYGETHYLSMLTENQVISIRQMHSTGIHENRFLADKFGITLDHLYQIINRKSWKHI